MSQLFNFYKVLLFALISAQGVLAQNECLKKDPSVPLCPSSGSTLLDDTYPVKSYVISTSRGESTVDKGGVDIGMEVSVDFISKVMNSYANTPEQPEIVVPTDEGSYNELVKRLKEKFQKEGMDDEKIQTKINQIKHADVKEYTWQQDFFESFVDPATGTPSLRPIASYDEKLKEKTGKGVVDYTKSISQSLNCVESGNFLRSNTLSGMKQGTYTEALVEESKGGSSYKKNMMQNASWWGGEMGGNIEGLPGGLCLKGNNQSQKFAQQYCGSVDNMVEVDVGWLSVGHADEVIKVVPVFPKSQPEECSFTIWLASPTKALEVMKDPNYAKRSFVEEDSDDSTDFNDIYLHVKKTGICDLLKSYDPSGSNQGGDSGSSVIEAYIKRVIDNLKMDAHAADTSKISCKAKLRNITNGDMARLIESDPDYSLTNKLVQEKMNNTKEEMKKKLAARLPQCKEIKFLDVPDLFYNKTFAEINGEKVLPQPGVAGSLFQNPTNSVLANKTMIISETPNFGFNDYMKKLTQKQGIKAEYVDTWNFAHISDGNMHCSSHSLPYCRPREQGQ